MYFIVGDIFICKTQQKVIKTPIVLWTIAQEYSVSYKKKLHMKMRHFN